MKKIALLLVLFTHHSFANDLIEDMRNEILPSGIPATATSASQCLKSHEIATIDNLIESTAYSRTYYHCGSELFIKPQKVISNYGSYVPGQSGDVYDCRMYRKSYTYTRLYEKGLNKIFGHGDNTAFNPSASTTVRDKGVRCMATILNVWAKQSALEEIPNASSARWYSKFWQNWMIGSFATTFLKSPSIKNRLSNKGQLTRVLNWFTRLRQIVQTQIDDRPIRNKVVNMAFSRAASILATGIVTEHTASIEEAYDSFEVAIKDITYKVNGVHLPEREKGFLPEELHRRNKALGYHGVSIGHLTQMVNLSSAIGCSFFTSEFYRGKLNLLIRKTIEGRSYPEDFNKAVAEELGIPQSSVNQVDSPQVEAFLEALVSFEDPNNGVEEVWEQTKRNVLNYLTNGNRNATYNSSPTYHSNFKHAGKFIRWPKPNSLSFPANKKPSFCN